MNDRQKNKQGAKGNSLSNVGIVFVSPIVGLTPSLSASFQPLIDEGATYIGIDIFDAVRKPKTFWKILGLTMLPGAHKRRIAFANTFEERRVFDRIEEAIRELRAKGKKVVLGGMSGGFIFVSRIVQNTSDSELAGHPVRELAEYVVGLFGISPLIYYPLGVYRPDTRLDAIPAHMPTILFFADGDDIIPPGTVKYAEEASNELPNIAVHFLRRHDFHAPMPLKHQYFGGPDFVSPLTNIFWHPPAEKYTIDLKYDFLKKIALTP